MVDHARVRVVIADDHPIVLSGLRALLGSRPELEIVGTANDGTRALHLICSAEPDLALLDINMPGLTGVDILQKIEGEGLSTRVILLTASASDSHIERAVQCGAWGILLKDTAADDLLAAIDQVLVGERWLPQELVGPAIHREVQRRSQKQSLKILLTSRELELVQLVAEGLANKQIARRLSISEGTVKIHLHNIYQKLGVSNRTALATLAHKSADETEGDG
jgi:two-component system nitrate/nitrite response regulator NarL